MIKVYFLYFFLVSSFSVGVGGGNSVIKQAAKTSKQLFKDMEYIVHSSKNQIDSSIHRIFN